MTLSTRPLRRSRPHTSSSLTIEALASVIPPHLVGRRLLGASPAGGPLSFGVGGVGGGSFFHPDSLTTRLGRPPKPVPCFSTPSASIPSFSIPPFPTLCSPIPCFSIRPSLSSAASRGSPSTPLCGLLGSSRSSSTPGALPTQGGGLGRHAGRPLAPNGSSTQRGRGGELQPGLADPQSSGGARGLAPPGCPPVGRACTVGCEND